MVYINFTQLPSADNIFKKNYYPYLYVQYHLKGKAITIKGIVDTGSTYTILHSSVAPALGIQDYKSDNKGNIFGISGVVQPVYFHEVELVVPSVSKKKIKTWIGFSEIAAELLLGHAGFFEHFRVTVEYSKLRFGLEPIVSDA